MHFLDAQINALAASQQVGEEVAKDINLVLKVLSILILQRTSNTKDIVAKYGFLIFSERLL